MRVGDSRRTPSSSCHLPPSSATWRSQEVQGWVPSQCSQSQGGQSSLTWASPATGAGRKARRVQGSAAREPRQEPRRSRAAPTGGPSRQFPTQRERGGAAEQQADLWARCVDVPGARALSGAPEHLGKRAPAPPCAEHPALTGLRVLAPAAVAPRVAGGRREAGGP